MNRSIPPLVVLALHDKKINVAVYEVGTKRRPKTQKRRPLQNSLEIA